MNFLKFGRGDFFGIIIPGAFLLINALFLYPEVIDKFIGKPDQSPLNNATLLLPALFVVSYIMGMFLRAIKPSLAERMTFILWIPHLKVLGGILS